MVFRYRYDLNTELIKQYRLGNLFKILTVGLFGSQMNKDVGSSDFGPHCCYFEFGKNSFLRPQLKSSLKFAAQLNQLNARLKIQSFS